MKHFLDILREQGTVWVSIWMYYLLDECIYSVSVLIVWLYLQHECEVCTYSWYHVYILYWILGYLLCIMLRCILIAHYLFIDWSLILAFLLVIFPTWRGPWTKWEEASPTWSRKSTPFFLTSVPSGSCAEHAYAYT